MIRSEHEYREAVGRIDDEAQRLKQQEEKLVEMGLGRDEVKRAMDPMLSFHQQLRDEVESYEIKYRQWIAPEGGVQAWYVITLDPDYTVQSVKFYI